MTVRRRFGAALLLAKSLAAAGVFCILVFVFVSHMEGTSSAVVIAIAGLILSSALSPLIGGLAAGIYLFLERPIRIGQRVSIDGIVGVVEDIVLRTTILRCDDGSTAILPNASLINAAILADIPPPPVPAKETPCSLSPSS